MYETQILPVGINSIELASKLLKSGEIVAIPTETVYGLAANALDDSAVNKIFEVKGRPNDNPLIVHIHSMDQVQSFAKYISDDAKSLMEKFWPGPLTLVLKKRSGVSNVVTANLDTVALRMPHHPVALGILQHCNMPLAAPSANLSGKPSPTSSMQVYEDLNKKIPLIIDGGNCVVGLESTVVNVSDNEITILRPGAITREMLERIVGYVSTDKAALNPLDKDTIIKSPGVKYRHYAPQADIEIVRGVEISIYRYITRAIMLDKEKGINSVVLCTKENEKKYPQNKIILGSIFRPETIAENLFNSLREIDKRNYQKAYVQFFDTVGINAAIMNRLLKASNHNVIDVG